MTIALRPPGILGSARHAADSSQSVDGSSVRKLLTRINESNRCTARTAVALADLDIAVQEANRPNWDGYDALPARSAAFEQARRLLEALPAGLPLPAIFVVPEGGIALEWNFGTKCLFSVIVSGANLLSYAGIFGPNKVHGMEQFEDGLPPSALAGLARALGRARPEDRTD